MTQSKLPTKQKQNSQTEDRVVMVEGEGGAGGKGPEFRVSRYKLFYAQLMNNQVLMYSTWASQVALVLKNLPVKAGDVRDVSSIPGSGRSPGGGNGNSLQDTCLENPMHRGAWGATVDRVSKESDTTKPLKQQQQQRPNSRHSQLLCSLTSLTCIMCFMMAGEVSDCQLKPCSCGCTGKIGI